MLFGLLSPFLLLITTIWTLSSLSYGSFITSCSLYHHFDTFWTLSVTLSCKLYQSIHPSLSPFLSPSIHRKQHSNVIFSFSFTNSCTLGILFLFPQIVLNVHILKSLFYSNVGVKLFHYVVTEHHLTASLWDPM